MTGEVWQAVVTYCKVGRLRYLSHLDVARALERAVRRARLPVAYTEGFNKRMRIRLGPPLAVGMEGDAELLALILAAPLAGQEIVQRLNQQLPPELSVVSVELLPANRPSPLKYITWASYVAELEASPPVSWRELAAAAERSMSAETLLRRRQGKGPDDVRRRIRDLTVAPDEERLLLRMTLGVAQHNYLSPDDCLRVVEGQLRQPAQLRWTRIVRTRLLSE